MTTIALATVLALAAPAQADDIPTPPSLALDSYTLPNGLKVALHRDPTVPRVTVCVAYHVGSKNERAGRTGFAHFFEHMMFRGTKNVPNYDIPLQETGAQSNAFTSEDMTVYHETVPSNFLERVLYLEAERLAFLPTALDQAKFDTEREVVKNERRQSMENVPYGLAQETLLANVFPEGHPYSWDVIGSMKDLNRSTIDDLRKFFAEFYHPGNAALCLAGDFDPAEARRLIDAYFGPLSGGPPPPVFPVPTVPAVSRSVVQLDKVKLPRLYWAWPGVAEDHPDAAALDTLAAILADGEASRLHTTLVVRDRIAKDVDASDDTMEIGGLFTIRATVAPGKAAAAVEAAIAAEIETIRAEAPSPAELARARATYESGFYSGLTSPLRRATAIAVGFVQNRDPAYYRTEFKRRMRVSEADVQRVARTYLVDGKVTLRVDPLAPGQEETPAVVAGPKPGAPDPVVTLRPPQPGPDWSRMPGPSAAVAFRGPAITRGRLKNGVEVWIAPWRTLPIASAQLILHAGTGDEPADRSGLAALAASLLDKGTKDRTATQLAEDLEALGGGFAVAPGADHTTIGVRGLSRTLGAKFEILGRILAAPRLDPADVDRERQLQLTDILQGPDSASWIARRAFPPLLYGRDHPYGRPTQGDPGSVRTIDGDDLSRWFRNRIVPAGATLIVVGDVDPPKLLETLDRALGGWTGTGTPPTARPAPTRAIDPGVAYLVDKPGAPQSVLAVGRRWIDRADPSYFATLVGNHALGADFLSRLNQNLREEHGYSYGAGSAFRFRKAGSTWSVNTSVRADATVDALREVIKELDDLPEKRPIRPEEFAVAVDSELRSYPETFESPNSILSILSEMALFGLPDDYLDTYLARLQKVSPEEVTRAMTRVVDPRERVVLVVGDRKSVEPNLKSIGFREVRVVDPDGNPAPR